MSIDSNTRKVAKFTDIAGHWAQEEIIAASCSATCSGMILWYTGSKYSANSTVDKTKLEYPTTEAILKGVDTSDGKAVQKSFDAYAEKRIAEIRATTSNLKAEEGKNTYCVSADGDDANDGLSPGKAWKTLDKVSEMATSLQRGDAVLFRRGDEFRGKLKTKNYVTYSAYGEGFGRQRPDRPGSTTATIKGRGGTNNSKNFLICDNVVETNDSYAALIHMCVDDAKNMPEVTGNIFANLKGQKFGLYGIGAHNRDAHMIKFNEKILATTIGLEDNTLVFVK